MLLDTRTKHCPYEKSLMGHCRNQSIWMAVYKQLAPRLSSSTKQILCIKLMNGICVWGRSYSPIKKDFRLKIWKCFFPTTRGQVTIFFHPYTLLLWLPKLFVPMTSEERWPRLYILLDTRTKHCPYEKSLMGHCRNQICYYDCPNFSLWQPTVLKLTTRYDPQIFCVCYAKNITTVSKTTALFSKVSHIFFKCIDKSSEMSKSPC